MTETLYVTVQNVVEAIEASGEPTVGIQEADILGHVQRKYNSEVAVTKPIIEKQTKKSIKMGLDCGIIEKQDHLYRLPTKFDTPTPKSKSGKSKSDKKTDDKIETIYKRDESSSNSRKRKHSSSSQESKQTPQGHATDDKVNQETRKRKSSKSSTKHPSKKKDPKRACASEGNISPSPRSNVISRFCSTGSNLTENDAGVVMDKADHDGGGQVEESESRPLHLSSFSSSSSSSDLTFVPEEVGVDEEDDDDEDEEGDEEEEDDDDGPCTCPNCTRSAAYNRSFYKTEEYRKRIEYVQCTEEDLERVRLKNKERRERRERRIAERREYELNIYKGETNKENVRYESGCVNVSGSPCYSNDDEGVPSSEENGIISQYVNGFLEQAGSLLSSGHNPNSSAIGGEEIKTNRMASGDGAKNVGVEEITLDGDESVASIPKNVDVCQERCCLKKES